MSQHTLTGSGLISVLQWYEYVKNAAVVSVKAWCRLDVCYGLCCDSTGRGCGRGDPVVSQLPADSRATHRGCGQVQEPGVDKWKNHCRLGTCS